MVSIEELLTKKSIEYKSKGKDLLVRCLNPEHEDDKPSMRIDREEGKFHCLSCGYKGNIFSYFNQHRNIFSSRVRDIKSKLVELRKASWSGYGIPQDAFFVSNDFRGISRNIIEQFQGFLTYEIGMEDRLVFPVFDEEEKIIAFIGRYINSNESPKYLMYPKEVSMPWYPNSSRVTPINNSIIVVEGILDALYLHSKGLTNAVCAFGTKSFSMENIYDLTLSYRLTGVEKVYIMMDGDEAGRSSSKFLDKCISYKTDMLTEVIDLQDGKDPATLTDGEINLVYKTLTSV